MSVLVVIPTVTGREDFKRECVKAYQDTGPSDLDFFIQYDLPTCAHVWNAGAKIAHKLGHDYVHMTADDLIPHAGWYEAAIETIEAGYLPGAIIYNPGGTIQVQGEWGINRHDWKPKHDWEPVTGASVPFCKTYDWIDIPNIHYYSDNAYDFAQQEVNGHTFVARTNYAFTHRWALEGRKELTDVEKKIWKDWEKTL